jgi:hypothetical protein
MVASAPLYTDLARITAIKKALADAKARAASSYATFVTNGTGTVVPSTSFDFGASFTHEPAVLSGAVVTRSPGTGWQMPRATAGVTKWVRNAQGLYTGAFLYFTVDCPGDPNLQDNGLTYPPPNPCVVHHLVFQAIGFTGLSTDTALDDGTAYQSMIGGTASGSTPSTVQL